MNLPRTANAELCEKLITLGIGVDTYFYWDVVNPKKPILESRPPLWEGDYIPALLVEDLEKILPNEIDEGTGNYFLAKTGMVRGYRDPSGVWLCEIQGTSSEADAWAKILIWLLENGYKEYLK